MKTVFSLLTHVHAYTTAEEVTHRSVHPGMLDNAETTIGALLYTCDKDGLSLAGV